MIATIIKQIANSPNKGYERQLKGVLLDVVGMPLVGLDKVLENSMIPYSVNVPEYSSLKNSVECIVRDS